MSANESTPLHAAQMIAFRKLLDTDKSCFRQDLRAPEALQALREYNTAAPTSLNASALAAPGPSAEDTTIFQGTCLVYAYLEQEQLLRPAWNGAPCALALDTVRTFTNFRGSFREERKITYMAMTTDDEEAHETTKPPWAPPPVCSGQGASENEAVRCKSPKAGTLQEFSMVISNKVMAIRAVDRVVTLTPPPREGEPDLDSLHYLPFSAAVGPMAVQKFPSPPGDDAWAKRRHDFYLAMQSTHGVSLSYDKKSGKLRVPKSMDQMLAAAPLLPAIMSLAPGLLKSQGVANVSAFCVAALQLASFACRFGRDRRVLELVPGLDFDDRPACLTDHTFLARQLLCVWRARIAGGVAGRNYHVHLAAVTECFIEIARDAERGGVSDDGPGHPKGTYLRLCWLGAVFTTMVKVRGSIVYGYRARAVMLNDARDVQLLCSDWPMGGCEWTFRFHCMRAVANKHGTLDSTGVQGEWELEVANQTNWDVASAAHVGLAAVRLAVKHCLVRATDIPPQELSACGVRPAEIVPTAPVGPPIDSCRRRKRARVVKCDSEEDCDEDWESGRRPRKARQKKGGRPVRVSDEEHASADDKDFVCIPSS